MTPERLQKWLDQYVEVELLEGAVQGAIEAWKADRKHIRALPTKLARAFKKWFVKRPDGGCQVLLPLSELDATIDAALREAEDAAKRANPRREETD